MAAFYEVEVGKFRSLAVMLILSMAAPTGDGRPHLVPLAPQAVAILRDLHKLTAME